MLLRLIKRLNPCVRNFINLIKKIIGITIIITIILSLLLIIINHFWPQQLLFDISRYCYYVLLHLALFSLTSGAVVTIFLLIDAAQRDGILKPVIRLLKVFLFCFIFLYSIKVFDIEMELERILVTSTLGSFSYFISEEVELLKKQINPKPEDDHMPSGED